MWCIHRAVSTRPLLGRNCASFYRSGLTSIWPIIYRSLSMPLLVACRCLSRLMNLSIRFRELPFSMEMSPVWLKYIYSVLCVLTWRPILVAARSRLCSRVSAGGDICLKRYIIGVVRLGNCFCGVGYLLLLSFVSLNPFSLILSINTL